MTHFYQSLIWVLFTIGCLSFQSCRTDERTSFWEESFGLMKQGQLFPLDSLVNRAVENDIASSADSSLLKEYIRWNMGQDVIGSCIYSDLSLEEDNTQALYWLNKSRGEYLLLEHDNAFESAWQAKAICAKSSTSEAFLYAQVLSTLAVLHQDYGRYYDSIWYYTDASNEAFNDQSGLTRLSIENYLNTCDAETYRLKYNSALAYADIALRFSKAQEREFKDLEARALYLKARMQRKLADSNTTEAADKSRLLQEAIKNARASERIFREIGSRRRREATREIGFVALNIEDKFLLDSIINFLPSTDNKPLVFDHPDWVLGSYYFKMKDWSKTIDHMTKVINGFEPYYHQIAGEAYFQRYLANLELGLIDEAIGDLKIALQRVECDPNNILADHVNLEAVRQMSTACLRGLGEYGVILFRNYEVNRDTNSLTLALKVFKAFNKYWLASIRSPDETKVLGQYIHTAIRIYPYALLCAKTAYEDIGNVTYLEDYLNLTQGQRSRILLNDLSNDGSQDSEKWKSIQELQSEIRALETKQQYNPNGLSNQENKELLSKQELLKELLIQWEVETADKSPSPAVNIAEIQAQLEPKQAFLTIDLVNDTYIGLLITESIVRFYPLGQKDRIDLLIQHQHELLSADFRSQQVDSLNQELHQICRLLYTLIFEPIKEALSDSEDLLLAPSGYFGSLSYPCLVTKDFRLETVADWQHSPLLVHEMIVSIISSWPVYKTQQQLERSSYIQANVGSWASKNLTATFRRLINVQNPQISYIGGQCNSSSFLGNSATLDHIFLAVHAQAVSDQLAGTYLLFGSGDVLTYSDISQLDLKASLVVLAACETAQGQLVNYEGAYSMSRAFQQAGARNVLSNLWSVSGRATEVLLFQFYKYLDQGIEPQKALQDAQISLLKAQFGLQYVFPGCWGGGVIL